MSIVQYQYLKIQRRDFCRIGSFYKISYEHGLYAHFRYPYLISDPLLNEDMEEIKEFVKDVLTDNLSSMLSIT